MLAGQLVLASPKLIDPNFYRTVMLMLRHDEEGAMALVLNRPTQTRVADVWGRISEGPCLSDGYLYHGGPCEGPLMLLHTHPPAGEMEIGHGLYLAMDQERVRWLIEQDGGPTKAFVGYAGWAAGQFEAELAEGSWLRAPIARAPIFESDPSWDRLLTAIAPPLIDVKIVPEDPSLN